VDWGPEGQFLVRNKGEYNNISKTFWCIKSIHKALILDSRVYLDKVSSNVNLTKREVGLIDKLCELKDETIR